MDFDLEIINEEDDCPNHLFESIMNAMNSMKEATADKIYQKIQRDGETNYSKPQVDKALAKALKYGIFEVRNNRYRVRDEILDDEDTVYWKLHERKGRTPFRIHERISEREFGLKLDPERDNQRFRNISSSQMKQCPHCGRVRRIKSNNKEKDMKKKTMQKKSVNQKSVKKNRKSKHSIKRKEICKHGNTKRKVCHNHNHNHSHNHNNQGEPNKKMKKTNKCQRENDRLKNDTFRNDFWNEAKELQESGSFDSTYSHINFLEVEHDLDDMSKDKKNVRNEEKKSQSPTFPQRSHDDDYELKSVSSGFKSNPRQYESNSDVWDSLVDCKEKKTTRNENYTRRNQYLRSGDEYNQYANTQANQHTGTSDWLGHSDEPQGTIIQSNNVLTIQPMDSLAFKSPEQASYIT